MKKHYTYTRATNLGAIIIILVCAIITSYLVQFTLDTCSYIGYSIKIKSIERDAEQGYWSANGFVTWNDSLTEEYNRAMLEKEEFISNNGVGNFLYHCGYSLIGQVIRIIVICAIIQAIVCTTKLAVKAAKFINRNLDSNSQKTVRRVSSYRYR